MNRILQGFFNFWKKGDLLLLFLCVLASAFGTVIVASATNNMGNNRYVIIQVASTLVGIILYIFLSNIDLEILAERRELLFFFNLIFIGLLITPLGIAGTSGNRSWLDIPLLPFNVQPAEICKITFILLIAKVMTVHQNNISSLKPVLHIGFHLAFIVGLILVISRDLGVALIYIFIFLVMAFAGGISLWWFLGGFASLVIATPFIWPHMRADQQERIMMIFDPSIDPTGQGVRWDTTRSLMSLTGGGLTGQGLFNGNRTQSSSLYAGHTDYIFSAIGEELGLLGCIFTILLLTLIVIRCIYVGLKTPNYMNRLVCIGVGAMLTFQILVNVGMCMGVLPVIGLTLPFISYGGSSMISMYLAMGIVSSVHMRPSPDSASRYVRPYYD